MRRRPLVIPASLATLFLISAAGPLYAVEPKTLPEYQARLNERAQALTKGLDGLNSPQPPADLQATVTAALAALPAELDARASLRRQQGMSDDGAAAKTAVASAAALQAEFWRARPAGPPEAPFVGALRRARDALLALLGASNGPGSVATRQDASVVDQGVRRGRGAVDCARGAFDGGACGGAPAIDAATGQTGSRGSVITQNKSSLASGGTAKVGGNAPPIPASPESTACILAVNGPDPSKPQHSSIASLCHTSPSLAPVLAGLLDAVKEQFGTVSGIIMNLIFLLLGILMAIATGAIGLILKLVALIGAAWAIFSLIRQLIGAVRDYAAAPAGSPARAAALRAIGKAGGSILIMVAMVLGGMQIGKTQLGQSAGRSMTAGMGAAMDKIGGTALMESLNAKIPAGVLATLESFMGKAPTAPGKVGAGAAPPPPGFRQSLTLTIDRLLGRDAKGLTARVAQATEKIRPEVTKALRERLGNVLGESTAPVTRAKYNELLQEVRAFASAEGVQVNPGRHWLRELLSWPPRTLSVEPKGLKEIDLVAFGRDMTPAQIAAVGGKPVSASALHELFHVFHTVQLRATLLRSGLTAEESVLFARMLENGGSYMALEGAATQIGNPMSWALSRNATSAARYKTLVSERLGQMETAIGVGRVRMPLGWTAEEMYAGFISRAPIVLGQSLSQLAGRMTFAYFMYAYTTNLSVSATPLSVLDPATLRDLGLSGNPGFRELVNAMVFGPTPEMVR